MANRSNNNKAQKGIQQRKIANPKKNNGRQAKSAVVRAPTSLSVRRTTPSSGKQQVCFITDVKKGMTPFSLHPGNIPWLKGVCPSYQKWRLHNVRIWYEPRLSTSTNGTVALGILQDYADTPPTSLGQLTTTAGSSRAAVWDKVSITVPAGKLRQYCSLSSFQDLGNEDKNERAAGVVYFYADLDTAFSDKDVVGRLYISYVPELVGPTDPSLQA